MRENFSPPPAEAILPLIRLALAEDIGPGDVTGERLIPENLTGTLAFVAREKLVVSGGFLVAAALHLLDPAIKIETRAEEGAEIRPGTVIARAQGNARALLAGERTALNLLQRTSAVATLTRKYVEAVAGTRAKILDTRKTIPGFRLLDKYAVACGGGVNHRFGLYDAVLIKDNHIALLGGVTQAVQKGRGASGEGKKTPPSTLTPQPLIVECDTIAQVQEALAAAPDRILLDNMTPDQLRQAVTLANGKIPLEASGGVNLQTVREIAETGVDFISIGALTHSAPAVDIGADVVFR